MDKVVVESLYKSFETGAHFPGFIRMERQNILFQQAVSRKVVERFWPVVDHLEKIPVLHHLIDAVVVLDSHIMGSIGRLTECLERPVVSDELEDGWQDIDLLDRTTVPLGKGAIRSIKSDGNGVLAGGISIIGIFGRKGMVSCDDK